MKFDSEKELQLIVNNNAYLCDLIAPISILLNA